MRKVRAGDEQGTASGQRAAETVAKRRGSLRSLKSHHERHDCGGGRKTLHERQLHLERMLTLVRGRMLANDGGRRRDVARRRFVDRGDPEGGLESARGHDRHAVEADEMRRSHEHHDVEAPALQEPVGVRRDRT